MKCCSGEHLIRECESDPVTSDANDDQPKSKDTEKKVATVNSAQQEQVSAVQTGRIFDDEDALDWGSD